MAVRGLLADSRRIPQIRLEVRENKTEIWEASQRSFDGCWPLSLITQSSVGGGRRMRDFIFFYFCLLEAKVTVSIQSDRELRISVNSLIYDYK